MMQAASKGEAKACEMKAVTLAALADTNHEGQMTANYLWHKTRESHPEILNQVKPRIMKITVLTGYLIII